MTFITDEEWDKKMANYNHNTLQNAGLQGALGAYANQMRRNPLDGFDIRNCPMEELELMINVLTKEYDRRTRHTPLQGPTRAELETNEALRNAWEQFEVIRKLQGK